MCYSLPGELTCSPITMQDLGTDNQILTRMYAYARTLEGSEVEEDFSSLLRMASDYLCNLCHEMKIDPMILDYWDGKSDYIITPFEPYLPD